MATYEYNGAIDQLDVTTGQAFQNESYLDKYAAARRENSSIIVNDAFKVVQDKGMFVPCYKQVQEYLTVGGTTTREGWYYFYSDGKKVQFATVDEAIEYVEAYPVLLQWMSGIAASTQEVMKHYKVDVDMLKVASPEDMNTIMNILTPEAESVFVGLRYLMVRYTSKDKAYARAFDVETTVYCGWVEVEEVPA